ncbi:methyltransferase [Oleiphilus messinensis]|uniref:Methyltransferase n=1 Tax=Oleiphilus messinensis TaxID=141451 RepID=A0A1Y0I4J5_9GAMM|nr:methyltransferase domain-containing protein [Oleiphilus messinensis]ARU55392.1 methyltransferase [Oleiphilus messinensis]
MSVNIRIATTDQELNDVFRIRHQVFADEEKRLKTDEEFIYDRYDCYDNTVNFIAYVDQKPVGAMRLSADTMAGVPLDDHYDVSDLRARCVNKNGGRESAGCITQLCVSRRHRATPYIVKGLMQCARLWVANRNLKHCFVIIDQAIEKLLTSLGFDRIADPFVCERIKRPLVRMHCPMSALMLDTPEIPPGPDTPSRFYFRTGEPAVQQGGAARNYFQVIKGRVRLLVTTDTGIHDLGELKVGDIFGQRNIPENTYMYTAECLEDTQLIEVTETEFLAYASQHPERVYSGFEFLANSLQSKMVQIAQKPITGIDLFNDYLIARILQGLNSMGGFELFQQDEPVTIDKLADKMQANPESTQIVLDFLVDMRVMQKHDSGYQLPASEREGICREMGFLEWLVGGYNPVIAAIEGMMKGELVYGKEINRNDQAMAASSAHISKYFTDQHMLELLELDAVETLLDIGCGSGLRLIDICERIPKLKGIGVDISPDCCKLATSNVEKNDLASRIRVEQGHAESWILNESERLKQIGNANTRPADLVMCFAMMHDLLNHEGMAEKFLTDIKTGLGEGAYIMIQDQMQLPSNTRQNRDSWGRGFEVIHHFMGQRLFLVERYEQLFKEVGLKVIKKRLTDIPENWIFLLQT